MTKRGTLIVLSGPSGSGKSTVIDRLLDQSPIALEVCPSVTTRPPRKDDTHTKQYIHLEPEQFQQALKNSELLEWAEVSGHWYGTPRQPVEQARADGRSMLLEIDVQGGMSVKHNFPADGEYKFSIQNFGIGTYIPGEKIEFLVDGVRVKLLDYVGVGLTQGMSGENDGSIDVIVPVKAGTHVVGATFVQTNYRPSLNIVKEFERKSLDNQSIAQLQYYPIIGWFRISGPFGAQRPEDNASRRKMMTCQPANAAQEEACAKQIMTTLARKAFRRPVNSQDLESLMGFYEEGRKLGMFEDGLELALRRLLTRIGGQSLTCCPRAMFCGIWMTSRKEYCLRSITT